MQKSACPQSDNGGVGNREILGVGGGSRGAGGFGTTGMVFLTCDLEKDEDLLLDVKGIAVEARGFSSLEATLGDQWTFLALLVCDALRD
jgi:hypothetical protein